MTKKKVLFIAAVLTIAFVNAQKKEILYSPDNKFKVLIDVNKNLNYIVVHENDTVFSSSISLVLSTGEVVGENLKNSGVKRSSHEGVIQSPFYKKNEIKEQYNELAISIRSGWRIIFRAYDEGVAYRYVKLNNKRIDVTRENMQLDFLHDAKAYVPYVHKSNKADLKSFEKQYFNSFENTYAYESLSEMNKERLIFLPMVVELNSNKKLCITESDLEKYPGMYLHKGEETNTLDAVFAPYPKTVIQGGHNMLQGIVKERENYIARLDGVMSLPWRVFQVSVADKDLANSDLVYKLASPSKLNDVSWIKPGKVAWDWWNAWNIYDVDFEAGINNATYKYYIDFASRNNIEYVILDEGWAINNEADMMKVIPEINLPELIEYGKSKGVGVILWAGYWAVKRDIEGVCKHYADMGVKGFKVDFLDRDDQEMVNFIYELSKTAAKYKLILDFHGTYKPTGLQRTYPNVLNFEGVFGLEQMKWSPKSVDMVTYDVTMPFIRMVAGPVDYTQGAMRNATRESYAPIGKEPMSQGTRCHQLAMYVVFESPVSMLCDSPTNYKKEQECLDAITEVPVIWDETKVIEGEVGKYIITARRKGNCWYIGGLNNWDARKISLDISFIKDNNPTMHLFKDGKNAHRIARDYRYVETKLADNKKVDLYMAPGGGFLLKIQPESKILNN